MTNERDAPSLKTRYAGAVLRIANLERTLDALARIAAKVSTMKTAGQVPTLEDWNDYHSAINDAQELLERRGTP